MSKKVKWSSGYGIKQKPYYTIREVSTLLSVSNETIRRKVKNGSIQMVEIMGKKYIPFSDLFLTDETD